MSLFAVMFFRLGDLTSDNVTNKCDEWFTFGPHIYAIIKYWKLAKASRTFRVAFLNVACVTTVYFLTPNAVPLKANKSGLIIFAFCQNQNSRGK